MNHRRLIWLALAALVLAGCMGQPERLWLKSPGWSRGQLIGQTRVPDPVPIVLDGVGNIYIFTFVTFDNGSSPRVIALDHEATTIWQHTYEEISHRGPHQPKLLWDGQGLQLLWIARGSLHRASVDANGNLARYEMPELDFSVDAMDAAIDNRGLVSVALAGPSEESGLYLLHPDGSTIIVDPLGLEPDIQYDREGILHLAWRQMPPASGDVPLLYGAFPGGQYAPDSIFAAATPRPVGTGSFFGPTLGLDDETAYIFWSIVYYGGELAGTVEASFAHFPKGARISEPKQETLRVPFEYTLPYDSLDGVLVSGPRVDLGSIDDLWATDITEMSANTGPSDELVMAITARIGYPMRKTKPQVAAAYFDQGKTTTYQQLSFTPASSSDPTIISDREGQLYLTWLERGDADGWGVYFSSTSPDLNKSLSGLDGGDVARVTAETVFGLVTGALLIPISLAWALPAMVVLALTSRLRRMDDSLAGHGALIGLALALSVLWFVKLAVLPGIQNHVPFSAWIPIIPDWLNEPLRLGVPIAIIILSALAAWRFLASRRENSPYVFVAIYAVVDGVLTMAIYGLFIYGAV